MCFFVFPPPVLSCFFFPTSLHWVVSTENIFDAVSSTRYCCLRIMRAACGHLRPPVRISAFPVSYRGTAASAWALQKATAPFCGCWFRASDSRLCSAVPGLRRRVIRFSRERGRAGGNAGTEGGAGRGGSRRARPCSHGLTPRPEPRVRPQLSEDADVCFFVVAVVCLFVWAFF